MTTNYARGAAFERRVRDDMRRRGFYVMRSPRSGGLVDILAVHFKHIFFIQAKRNGRLPQEDRVQLVVEAKAHGATALLAEPRNLHGHRRMGIRYWLLAEDGYVEMPENFR